MSILEKINKPEDLQIIKKELLQDLAAEIRNEMIQTVSRTGGHLASSLGTVELAIALHYVFHAPDDKIIWDVGHQAYAHKLLTGRRESFSTLRTIGGISGFPRIAESDYDAFGVGHSSTSISAALGLAVARDQRKGNNKVIAVIGDGSMTGGMAFEGLQNAGHLGTDMLVILNDNEMFISHRVGALAGYLTKLLTAGSLKKLEARVERFFQRMHFWGSQILRVAKRFKVLLFPGMLFEEMGFSYLGPVDGHNIYELINLLSNVKDLKGPVLLHVITKKGKGYGPAESNPTRFHGIGRFNVITGDTESGKSPAPSYTDIFSSSLLKLAEQDDSIVAVTAAMADGTGLEKFGKKYPSRYFDVGIAEGHAVTFAAGMAANGLKPVCAVYSTFLQRAMDQIIHDVALQNLPVVFAIDRAGLVGEDGATHHGAFDLSYLRLVPGLTIMAPADENEFQHMLKTALSLKGPSAIRYPRGAAEGIPLDREFKLLPVGKAETLKEGDDCCIIALGSMVGPSLRAASLLADAGISAGVVNARFLKPLDSATLLDVSVKTRNLITVEENSLIGGLHDAVCAWASGRGLSVMGIGLPDAFVEHGSQKVLREKQGLTAETIAQKIKQSVSKQ